MKKYKSRPSALPPSSLFWEAVKRFCVVLCRSGDDGLVATGGSMRFHRRYARCCDECSASLLVRGQEGRPDHCTAPSVRGLAAGAAARERLGEVGLARRRIRLLCSAGAIAPPRPPSVRRTNDRAGLRVWARDDAVACRTGPHRRRRRVAWSDPSRRAAPDRAAASPRASAPPPRPPVPRHARRRAASARFLIRRRTRARPR